MTKKYLEKIVKEKREGKITFDLSTDNPQEIILKIKSTRDMDGNDLFDALYHIVHEVLEPALMPSDDSSTH